jgi:hypothetical protein
MMVMVSFDHQPRASSLRKPPEVKLPEGMEEVRFLKEARKESASVGVTACFLKNGVFFLRLARLSEGSEGR